MHGKNCFVLDCSVTMAWCFEDEITRYTENILDQLSSCIAFVPSLWSLEVANVLYIAEVKKRIDPIKTQEFREALSALPIQIDHTTSARAMGSILEIARKYSITVYDAAYLELAIRHQFPMATLDKALRAAIKKAGVSLWPEA